MNSKYLFETWLLDTTRDLISLCGMGTIAVSFRERKDEAIGKVGNGTVVFSISYDKHYKQAFVEYHPAALQLYKEKRIDLLVDGLTHEVCHIFTFPLFDLALNRFTTELAAREYNEQLAEEIATLLRRLIKLSRPDLLTLKGRKSKNKKK